MSDSAYRSESHVLPTRLSVAWKWYDTWQQDTRVKISRLWPSYYLMKGELIADRPERSMGVEGSQMPQMKPKAPCDYLAAEALLSNSVASAGFRADLRSAREACQRDAEAFNEVLFALERLGSFLRGHLGTLGDYRCCLSRLVILSGSGYTHFEELLTVVTQARNQALHQGAVARHLSSRVVEVSLILEDVLASRIATVEHLMVRQPIIAEGWHTLSMVRQNMLSNAFSYLPYLDSSSSWVLVADYELAGLLAESGKDKRDELLAKSLKTLKRPWIKATLVAKDATVKHALKKMGESNPPFSPLLVIEAEGGLAGIVTPADLL